MAVSLRQQAEGQAATVQNRNARQVDGDYDQISDLSTAQLSGLVGRVAGLVGGAQGQNRDMVVGAQQDAQAGAVDSVRAGTVPTARNGSVAGSGDVV